MDNESLEIMKELCSPKIIRVPVFSPIPVVVKMEYVDNEKIEKKDERIIHTQQKGVKITVKKLFNNK